MKLRGRGVLITGASQGLGKAIAEECVRHGADVVLCARNAGPLESVRQELAGLAEGSQVLARPADVADPEQARSVVEFAAANLPAFTGLVNNSGIYGPMGLIEDVDWTEWLDGIRTNLYGTVLPCRYAVPFFRKAGYGKIVNLSGGGATAPMPRISSYAASKAAVVRFTETLALETAEAHIDVNALAPGALNTRFLAQLLEAGPERVGQAYYDRALQQKEKGGEPLGKGAALTGFLLSGESDGITGRLISAIWDGWADLPARWREIARTDVYTLRRIVPKDRGMDWE